MKYTARILVTILYSLSLSATAAPIIGIGSMYDLLMPDESNLVKKVYNSGDSTAFVRVDVLEINLDSQGDEQELLPQQLDGAGLNKNRLIATPQRMIIPPSEFQSIRLLWPGSREKERYYRVRFIPVIPGKSNTFGLSEKQIKEYKDSIKAGVNIMAGYGSILYIMPTNPQFNTVITKEKKGISIRNSGNATIVLEDIRHCDGVKKECSATTREIVIPGRSALIKNHENEANGNIKFRLNEAGKTKEFTW